MEKTFSIRCNEKTMQALQQLGDLHESNKIKRKTIIQAAIRSFCLLSIEEQLECIRDVKMEDLRYVGRCCF